MIRLVKKNTVRGITSYDVYFGEEHKLCSVIVRSMFEPSKGSYRLEISGDVIVIRHSKKGWRIGEIRVGNGLYSTLGCVMHLGELTCGVLCVKGQKWLESLRWYMEVNGNELVIEEAHPVPPKGRVPTPLTPSRGSSYLFLAVGGIASK
mgnify:CR=1 FL=1